ncbi:phage tail assembly chaperone [Heliobacterium chlorum]|uniref:Phage tail assembly chaperone n=1 Tax=Heliobacterium chlorum TaxID=2698 RepID=A0ABR7T8F5_HELCL|nr:phage tail assembly chaperone [Heliobacterium chlorum]
MTRSDWTLLRQAAFGSLRITSIEFWQLTLAELLDMLEAVHENESKRQEAEYLRTAWLAANLMNATGNVKRPVTPDMLLGKEVAAKRVPRTDQIRTLEELQREFNAPAPCAVEAL